MKITGFDPLYSGEYEPKIRGLDQQKRVKDIKYFQLIFKVYTIHTFKVWVGLCKFI